MDFGKKRIASLVQALQLIPSPTQVSVVHFSSSSFSSSSSLFYVCVGGGGGGRACVRACVLAVVDKNKQSRKIHAWVVVGGGGA